MEKIYKCLRDEKPEIIIDSDVIDKSTKAYKKNDGNI